MSTDDKDESFMLHMVELLRDRLTAMPVVEVDPEDTVRPWQRSTAQDYLQRMIDSHGDHAELEVRAQLLTALSDQNLDRAVFFSLVLARGRHDAGQLKEAGRRKWWR